jgi:hypothetical protein
LFWGAVTSKNSLNTNNIMKGIYYITIVLAMLFTGSIVAQSGSLLNNQETIESLEIEKILEQSKKNQLLDSDLPPGWEFSTSDKVHIISVFVSANPNLCGIPIEPGDYIGVFYIDDDGNEACGGAAVWTGIENVGLAIYGDDSFAPGKDGFYSGEDLIWYVYSYSQGEKCYPAIPEYDPGYASNNKFYSGGLSIVWELPMYYKNDIIIPAGWSGLSSYTETPIFPPMIADVMAPISDELVILYAFANKIYYPAGGTNTMFIWRNNYGYKIKVTEEAVLPMPGCPTDDLSVDLDATWNIMPVFSACNVLATEIFNPIIDKVIVVKEIGGNKIFWPDMGIQTLQVLERGRAYYVAVSQNTSITYGDCQSYKSHPEPVESVLINHTPWNTPAETGSSHTFAFPAEVLQNMNTGDYIAAFNSAGTCVGMVQIEDPAESLPLTVFGDDPTTSQTEGLQDGEEILFRLYSMMENEALDLQITLDGNYVHHDGVFADNGLSVVSSLKVSSTGLSESDHAVFEIFPNPAGNQVNIKMNDNETYLLSLQNINGQQVLSMSFTDAAKLDVAHLGRGVYFVEIIGKDTRSINKLVLK